MIAQNVDGEIGTVKDDLVKLREDIANLSNALKDVASEAVNDQIALIRTRIDGITGEAKQHGRATLDELTARIEERPLASVLIAFGVGLLAGRLLDR